MINSCSKETKFLVAFSQCNSAEPYRAAQNKLMSNLFSNYKDIKLVISDAQQDNSKQIAQIETFIRQKPDLLIVAPNERAPLTNIMGEAIKAGIPTICLERDILEPNYTTYIRCDNFKIGQAAGEFIVNHLTKKYGEPRGKIVEIRGLLGVEGEINRYNGAHQFFDKYPKIEVIHEAVADWLQSNPMAIGAYIAAKEVGREKEMIFVGIDGLGGKGGGIKKVIDGILQATFNYPLCVDKAVELATKILKEEGFSPPKTIIMESEMIIKKNAEEAYKKYSIVY